VTQSCIIKQKFSKIFHHVHLLIWICKCVRNYDWTFLNIWCLKTFLQYISKYTSGKPVVRNISRTFPVQAGLKKMQMNRGSSTFCDDHLSMHCMYACMYLKHHILTQFGNKHLFCLCLKCCLCSSIMIFSVPFRKIFSVILNKKNSCKCEFFYLSMVHWLQNQ
jgi:hypothetical protein